MDLLVGHLLGDYIFQNDWMALNKTKMTLKGWAACAVHAWVYTTCVAVTTGWDVAPQGSNEFLALVLIFVVHFIQDKTRWWVQTWMWLMGSFAYFRETVSYGLFHKVTDQKTGLYHLQEAGVDTRPRDFWAVIIIDNSFHLLQLWAVQKFIVGV